MKKHDSDNIVTHFLPILVPDDTDQTPRTNIPAGTLPRARGSSGAVWFQEGSSTVIYPVKQFRMGKGQSPARFQAIAKVLSLTSGKKIDSLLLKDQLPDLFREVFSARLVDALTQQAIDNPTEFAARWLEPLFNREISAARLVTWSVPGRPFRPAIFCSDDQTALFVHLLFARIDACLGCGKLFTPDRPNQVYHDLRCANRHRKRRERLAKERRKKQ
jgi:hypothetical protein